MMEAIEMFQLETVIDRLGLPDTLDLIARICMEKSEHVAGPGWNDRELGRLWKRAAGMLDSAETQVRRLGLP